jgi:hypothetical protein
MPDMRGICRHRVHNEWVPKDEPLVWLADAVAGACPCVGARRSAVVEDDWQAARTVVIRLPS